MAIWSDSRRCHGPNLKSDTPRAVPLSSVGWFRFLELRMGREGVDVTLQVITKHLQLKNQCNTSDDEFLQHLNHFKSLNNGKFKFGTRVFHFFQAHPFTFIGYTLFSKQSRQKVGTSSWMLFTHTFGWQIYFTYGAFDIGHSLTWFPCCHREPLGPRKMAKGIGRRLELHPKFWAYQFVVEGYTPEV